MRTATHPSSAARPAVLPFFWLRFPLLLYKRKRASIASTRLDTPRHGRPLGATRARNRRRRAPGTRPVPARTQGARHKPDRTPDVPSPQPVLDGEQLLAAAVQGRRSASLRGRVHACASLRYAATFFLARELSFSPSRVLHTTALLHRCASPGVPPDRADPGPAASVSTDALAAGVRAASAQMRHWTLPRACCGWRFIIAWWPTMRPRSSRRSTQTGSVPSQWRCARLPSPTVRRRSGTDCRLRASAASDLQKRSSKSAHPKVLMHFCCKQKRTRGIIVFWRAERQMLFLCFNGMMCISSDIAVYFSLQ